MTHLPGVGGTGFYVGHGIKQDTHANAVANQWTLCNSSGSYYYDWVWGGGYSNAWSFTINNNVVTDLATDTPHGFVASSSTTPPSNGANSSTDYPATGTATISATDKYLHIFDSVNDQKFYVDVSSLVVGPGTLGSSFDTASFAGTTVQQIQWSITNGSSPTPNSNYYLFSETPGGTAKDTINIGSNPQAGATSTDTYQNPSGADFTGRWYIGYGQNATRVNLATYNFSRGKVFCNFW